MVLKLINSFLKWRKKQIIAKNSIVNINKVSVTSKANAFLYWGRYCH